MFILWIPKFSLKFDADAKSPIKLYIYMFIMR